MTAGFAHQVRTPLASAMLYVSQLDTSSPQQVRVVEKITARLNDLGRMVNDMLGFAAGAKPTREHVVVNDLLSAVWRTIEPQLQNPSILGMQCLAGPFCIAANKEALKGAILNLINNAEQACGDSARIELSAKRSGDRVLISVSDNGPGIPEHVISRAFEPFFTTRPDGTGLGLAVVREVVKAHNGEVFVQSDEAGSCFTISLPLLATEVDDCE
jgi:two-component system sensor histidine kinase FlrB